MHSWACLYSLAAEGHARRPATPCIRPFACPRLTAQVDNSAQASVTLAVGYLRSYEKMGRLQLECIQVRGQRVGRQMHMCTISSRLSPIPGSICP